MKKGYRAFSWLAAAVACIIMLFHLDAQHAQQRIFTQLVMVAEIFLAQRQRVHLLGHHLASRMGLELEAGLGTLCHSESRFLLEGP
jgi:hypothetical protein